MARSGSRTFLLVGAGPDSPELRIPIRADADLARPGAGLVPGPHLRPVPLIRPGPRAGRRMTVWQPCQPLPQLIEKLRWLAGPASRVVHEPV